MKEYKDEGQYPDEEVYEFSVSCCDCALCCDNFCMLEGAPLWDFYKTQSERVNCFIEK